MTMCFSHVVDSPIQGADVLLLGLQLDSRLIQKGDLFCALKGEKVDGHDYIDAAIQAGAAAIVMEHPANAVLPVSSSVDENLKNNLGHVASHFFGNPSASLCISGITGTNGKSSVCSYITQLMTLLGSASAEIGTLGIFYHDAQGLRQNIATKNTTPDAITLQSNLSTMLSAGISSVAMEVSSHALVQGRCNGIEFNRAVFTNLTHEHLDYHGNLKNYAEAKLQLFAKNSLQLAVVNIDDELAGEVQSTLAAHVDVQTYSIINDQADFYFADIQLSDNAIVAVLSHQKKTYHCEFPLLGLFNCSNLLAAMAVVFDSGFSMQSIVEKLPLLEPVDGRMQRVKNNHAITAVVDYAHTADALQTVLKTLSDSCAGIVHLVFGCGGDRDKEKRAQMARVAETFTQSIIVTADNPRSEKLDDINHDILSGFQCAKALVINDRRSAIKKAVSFCEAGDVVLIAGKGHEKYQLFDNEKVDFDDVYELSQALNSFESVS